MLKMALNINMHYKLVFKFSFPFPCFSDIKCIIMPAFCWLVYILIVSMMIAFMGGYVVRAKTQCQNYEMCLHVCSILHNGLSKSCLTTQSSKIFLNYRVPELASIPMVL